MIYINKDLISKEVVFNTDYEEYVCVSITLNGKDELLVCLIYR